jgi:chromosome segregation ATPase
MSNWSGSLLMIGSKDALFIKNFYQSELNKLDGEIKADGWKIEHTFEELSRLFYKKQSLMRDIEAHEKKRQNAYEALNNILNKEKDFEAFMHKETIGMYKEVSKNQTAKNIKIRQRMVSSDNEMRFASMMKYLDKYPEYQTKSTIKEIVEEIKHEERELKDAKKEHNHALAEYDPLFSKMMVMFKKSEEKIKRFNELLTEAKTRLANCRFNKWKISNLVSEEKKSAVSIDERDFRTPQFSKRIDEIKEHLSEYKPRKFVESEY